MLTELKTRKRDMELRDWDIPKCPDCGGNKMNHKCFSHVPSTASFRRNGWYCEYCKKDKPYRLGSVTEADAARFSLALLNK